MHDILSPKAMCSKSRDFFKFWEISDDVSLTAQGRDSYNGTLIGHRIWPIAMRHCQYP